MGGCGSVEEQRGLTAGLETEGYRWESRCLRHILVPYRFPYLIGQPAAPLGC